jgi:large repetitive protein
VQVTVGKESSQTFVVVPTFDSQGNPTGGNASTVQYGTSYILRVYVTNGAATATAGGPPYPTCEVTNEITCPTGTVQLTANGSPLDGGVFDLNNQGYTRDLSPFLGGGTYSLLAQYSGDSSYQASASASHAFTVTPAPSSTAILSPNLITLVGQSIPITVQAGVNVPGGVAPTGTFSYFDGGNPLTGTPFFNSSSPGGFIQAGISAVFNTVGKHSVTATYSGDGNYASSTTSSPAIVYAQYPTTVSISADSTNILYGKSVNITATAMANHTTPLFAGSLTFIPFGGNVGPVTTTTSTDGSGNQILKSIFSYAPQTSGFIQANYGGDDNYQSGSAFVSINVTVPDFALSLPPAVAIPVGQSASTQISIQPATNNSTSVALSCAGVLPTGYSCAFSPASVSLANGAAAGAQLTISLSPGSNAIPASSPKPTRAWLIPWRAGPSRLSFVGMICGLVVLVCSSLLGRGRKLRVISGLTVASLLWVVVGCGGGGSTSVGGGGGKPGPSATTLTVSTSAAKVDSATPVTFTAHITGQGTPTGNVTFFLSGSYYGEGTLSQGAATLTTTVSFPGVYTLTATYSGDSNHLASAASGVAQAVTGSTVLQINGQTGPLTHSAYITVTLQ